MLLESESFPVEIEVATSITSEPIIVQNMSLTPQVISSDDSGDIATTNFLNSYGLAFNTVFKLIVCVPCKSGYSLAHIHSHLRHTGSLVFEKKEDRLGDKKKWIQVKAPLKHNPSVQKMATKLKFEDEIAIAIQDQLNVSLSGQVLHRSSLTVPHFHLGLAALT